MTLGVYDGLHRAHMNIIQRVIASAAECNARSLLITFTPHPRHVLGLNGADLQLLTTASEKISILQDSALDGILFLTVDQQLLNMEDRTFVKEVLVDKLNVRKVIVGYDYHFGKDRSGKAERLVDYGEQFGFEAEIVSPIYFENEPVRSSRIRALLAQGAVARSARFLNRYYSLKGKVVHGSGRGSSLGFPTANIEVDSPEKMIPADGIYLTTCHIGGAEYFGMCNIGIRKTFNETVRVLEVHLLDAGEPELYGFELQISFLERLRDEIKFDSAEELVRQMQADENNCRLRIKKIKSEMEDRLNVINERN